MSTLALTHSAISTALCDNLPLTQDQRAALIGLVARDKEAQAAENEDAWDAVQVDGIATAVRDYCGPATAARLRRLIEASQVQSHARKGIYVASRASSAERPAMWRGLRDAGWPITSSWIDEAGEGETGDFGELWGRIEREIRSSRGLIIYAEQEDFPLKGAYIEAGIAIGAGLPVVVVLPGVQLEARSDRPMGSWIRHPAVTLCATLEEARGVIEASPAG